MPLPLIRTDFNSNSLSNPWTRADLLAQGITLHAGMVGIFYDFDREGDTDGLLHTQGTVWWDSTNLVFRIDLRTVSFSFTPGTDPNKLRAWYDQRNQQTATDAAGGV